MAKLNLGSSDIKQLIANYEGKQRQLRFEMDRLKGTVRSLKNSLPELEKAEAEQAAIMAAAAEMEIGEIAIPAPTAKPAARRGRPAGSTKSKADKKSKQAAPAKATKESKAAKAAQAKDRSSGYRLSEYDQLVFDTLRANGRAMINSDLVSYIEDSKKNNGETVEEGEVQKMVVRSLQKLANRRDDIRKVPYEGRGMAYALPEWLNGQGAIKKKHAHKA